MTSESSIPLVLASTDDESRRKQFVFTKGAIERVLLCCTNVLTLDGLVPIDSAMESLLLENVEALAEQGLRVLALAQKSWSGPKDAKIERDEVEEGLTLMGIVGLYDPPRPETKGAVAECHHAGIQVVSTIRLSMRTGADGLRLAAYVDWRSRIDGEGYCARGRYRSS